MTRANMKVLKMNNWIDRSQLDGPAIMCSQFGPNNSVSTWAKNAVSIWAQRCGLNSSWKQGFPRAE